MQHCGGIGETGSMCSEDLIQRGNAQCFHLCLIYITEKSQVTTWNIPFKTTFIYVYICVCVYVLSVYVYMYVCFKCVCVCVCMCVCMF